MDVGDIPSLYAVDLEVYPPYAWNGEDEPEDAFLDEGADGEEFEEEEVEDGEEEDGGEANEEEEDVKGGPDGGGRGCGNREEGRDGGAWWVAISLMVSSGEAGAF